MKFEGFFPVEILGFFYQKIPRPRDCPVVPLARPLQRNSDWSGGPPHRCVFFCLGASFWIAILVGGWTNPSEKILVKIGIFPNFWGENEKYLKPPPRITVNNKQFGPKKTWRNRNPHIKTLPFKGSIGIADEQCRAPNGTHRLVGILPREDPGIFPKVKIWQVWSMGSKTHKSIWRKIWFTQFSIIYCISSWHTTLPS